ncbi:uncharacterized protein K489DRAFT_379014 [Dissoconium aciculare CBS 342.82]|uniref:Uncharacterized protein n=1 Tax=Dissoconium aciculare CBS 342.82 TaxID=1314786 RepID=A0A6J3M983_9PEZI|nr:uncharacterized protein K489DRAFT_379014 [Dissoconium aciculare CBS 342.82]KAF1824575.1 hypothetical protein K489DRAFT_379014 [Dissoconium aciculare CBS 342.82]
MKTAIRKQQQQCESRKQTRLAEIAARRQATLLSIAQKAEACRHRHERHMRDLRQPKVARLNALLARQRELEVRMQACSVQIEQAFATTVQQLEVAISDRFDELGDA